MLNVAIYVCESGYCESCAVVDVGSDDSWATGKCGVNDTGVTGTSVLIKHTYPRRHSTPNTQRYPPQFGPPPTPRNANSPHPDFEIAEIAIWGKGYKRFSLHLRLTSVGTQNFSLQLLVDRAYLGRFRKKSRAKQKNLARVFQGIK